MGNDALELSKRWLVDKSKGLTHQLEALSCDGLKVDEQSQKGFIRCSFVVTDRVTDADENWHVGAMATLIDCVGCAAVYSFLGHLRASLDFSISFFSTAKTHEEVEVEGKVIWNRGRITSVVMEARRRSNGDLIALGKQWLAVYKIEHRASKL